MAAVREARRGPKAAPGCNVERHSWVMPRRRASPIYIMSPVPLRDGHNIGFFFRFLPYLAFRGI
jgi:hypothetical protein